MASYEKGGYEKEGYDVEYQHPVVYDRHHSVVAPDASGAVHGESFVVGNSTYAKLQRLAGRFNIEQRGIERVPEDERTDKSTWKVGTMWLAANMVVSSFAIGVLAVPVFALGFVDSILTIFFINLLGILPVCFFSTFGPRFGMRQMILSRFFFGYYVSFFQKAVPILEEVIIFVALKNGPLTKIHRASKSSQFSIAWRAWAGRLST